MRVVETTLAYQLNTRTNIESLHQKSSPTKIKSASHFSETISKNFYILRQSKCELFE